jgi:predicted nucleic acid-binding protein
MTRVLADTGPLVAYFNRRDRWHRWVVEQMTALRPPLVTCEAVLTEACFLIQKSGGKPAELVAWITRGGIEIGVDLESDAAEIARLMSRYRDTPMSLADACLVRLAERIPDCRVFTLDSDFAHYRRSGRQAIPLLTPAGLS